MNNFVKFMHNYANFKGRAGRKEFWGFSIVYMLLTTAFIYMHTLIPFSPNLYWYYLLYTGVVFVPWTAVFVRRMHDIGRSGTWIFLGLVPFIGWFWLLLLLDSKGKTGKNRYGYDPRKRLLIAAY